MFKKSKINFILFLLIILGSVLISSTMFRSGLLYDFGMGFWGPNGHDAIWHLSLISELKQNVPPNNPVYSGIMLQNYHWGFDLLVAIFSNIFHLSIIDIYFRIFPIIFSIVLGLLSYIFAYQISKNKITSLFFVFLNYFAGSFGYIVTLVKSGVVGGESLFWSMQSASILLNPPYAMSILVLFLGFIFWIKFKDSNSILKAVLIGIMLGLLSFIKVYAGIIMGTSLSIFFLVKFIKTKKFSKFDFTLCLTMGIFSIIILFFLGVLNGSSLMEFKPFWFVNSMIESIDKFYWPTLASYRFNLFHNLNFFKLPIFITIELFLLCIFLIGNMGTRVLSFLSFFHQKKTDINALILYSALVSVLIPLLFVQKGTAWNTIQFFYYFLIFMNFYLAEFLSLQFIKKNIFSKIIVIVILLLTVPTTFATLKDYFGFPPPSMLSNEELSALSFLKQQKLGVVLSYPYDRYFKNSFPSTPLPLYAYETTAYVTAFSQKQSLLADEMNLNIIGVDILPRQNGIKQFFSTSDPFFARGFLLNNNIDYIYLLNGQNPKVSFVDLQSDLIFENQQARIYKVRK